ncbi:PRC-barrel domain-containing protein [Cupriavidus sp. OV038]|uniref:PRC-barrel domain-containing protein n=1 Tax=unclassified Cupriavidus TaxID=2640874 RepID=UPI0008E80B71|nr:MULTISPECIES: PRC-barrel domain-containing protein [unclassified Cupriavidus]SFD40388.1 PRC-barrel domain-containing protein [Cupriavidus sp. OV038]SFQ10942.1 PRC-barrel domain-containing protein [Cupriavidus sp. OV096]
MQRIDNTPEPPGIPPGGPGTKGAAIIGGAEQHSAGPGPFVMASDTLEGNKVVDPSGEEIGTIDHIMLDVLGGRIAYAVLAMGGFLGIGEKLHALPWSALTLDTRRKCFVLGVERERIKAAPGFDKEHWPTMANSQWATTIHEYYGISPYWEKDRYDPWA